MKLEARAVGITAGSREVPGRKGLWQETSIIIIIIIIIITFIAVFKSITTCIPISWFRFSNMRPIFHSQVPRGSSQFLPELLGHNSGFVPGSFQTIDTVQSSQLIDNQLTLYSILLATLQSSQLIRTYRTPHICIRTSSIVTECQTYNTAFQKMTVSVFRSNHNLKNKLTI